MRLSTIDRKIINSIQEDIPLESAPFKALSQDVGLSEDELLQRIKRLKDEGIIRTFAASLDHRKLGFKSTLIALRVSPDQVESIAGKIIVYPEVTHCYLRKGEYNVYVVFISPTKERMDEFFGKLGEWVGKDNILDLATQKKFKLKTRFKI
jgi:DNA-binding Lrp family transcriptional regulator